jgi:hypothetical protein
MKANRYHTSDVPSDFLGSSNVRYAVAKENVAAASRDSTSSTTSWEKLLAPSLFLPSIAQLGCLVGALVENGAIGPVHLGL